MARFRKHRWRKRLGMRRFKNADQPKRRSSPGGDVRLRKSTRGIRAEIVVDPQSKAVKSGPNKTTGFPYGGKR